MGSKTRVVSNSGPPIHFAEIGCFDVFSIWKVLVSEEVCQEVKKHAKIDVAKYFDVKELSSAAKDTAAVLASKYDLDIGESAAIALAKQEGVGLFFTDDLDARSVAMRLGLEAHGSIGILLRAFRQDVITKEKTFAALDDLHLKSSLFVTRSLIEDAKKAIESSNLH